MMRTATRHRMGAHAMARNAAGGVGGIEESRGMTLLDSLYAFYQERSRLGRRRATASGWRVRVARRSIGAWAMIDERGRVLRSAAV